MALCFLGQRNRRTERKRCESTSSSYLCKYKTCNDEKEISLFEYQPTRLGDAPQKTLKGDQGIILSDKYAGYLKLIEKIHVKAIKKYPQDEEALSKYLPYNKDLPEYI